MQTPNYALLLACSLDRFPQKLGNLGYEAGDELDATNRTQSFQVWNADLRSHLIAADGYFKEVRVVNASETLADFISQINGDESVEEVHREVTQAVKEFIHHMEGPT